MKKKFNILVCVVILFLLIGIFLTFAPFANHLREYGYSALSLGILLGAFSLYILLQTKGLARLPEQTVNAMVIAKRIKKEWVHSSNGGWNIYDYIVIFHLKI